MGLGLEVASTPRCQSSIQGWQVELNLLLIRVTLMAGFFVHYSAIY